jgi:hypothetical protein
VIIGVVVESAGFDCGFDINDSNLDIRFETEKANGSTSSPLTSCTVDETSGC